MKLSKKTFLFLLLNILFLPLIGNEEIINLFHLNIISTVLYYFLPIILSIFLLHDYYKYLKDSNEKLKLSIESIIFIIFLIILSLSFIFSIVKASYTITNIIKISLCLYFLIILRKVNLNEKEEKIINYSVIYLLLFTSLLGILQYIFHFHITLAGIEKYPGALGRVKSTFYIATIFDKYLLISILYCLYLLLNRKINKIINIVAFVISNISLTFTFCRTSLIIILIIYFIILIYSIKRKEWLVFILILITNLSMLAIPGQRYVYSSIASIINNKATEISEKTNIHAISSVSNLILKNFIIKTDKKDKKVDKQLIDNIDYSLDSRKYFRQVAFNIMKSNPILGIGIGSYNYIFDKQNASKYIDKTKYDVPKEKYLYPHSMYAQLGSEIGILGMILFFTIFIIITIKSKNIYSYLILIIILLSCHSESIFYMKDVAYYSIFICALINNIYLLEDKKNTKKTKKSHSK